jgi:hypothetical protein
MEERKKYKKDPGAYRYPWAAQSSESLSVESALDRIEHQYGSAFALPIRVEMEPTVQALRESERKDK